MSKACRKVRLLAQFWALVAQEVEIVTRCAGIDLSGVKPVRLPGQPRERAKHRTRFERSPEWLTVRASILATHPYRCCHCGAAERLQVDHIRPKSKFPELALDPANLQLLCWPCNRTKAAR